VSAQDSVSIKRRVQFTSVPIHLKLPQSMKTTLGISVEAFSECYLGLPTVVGRITSGTFDHI
jgi:hypothetical protein